MKKRRFILCLVSFLLAICLGIGQNLITQPAIAQTVNLTVSSALSLKDALQEIKPIYQKKQSKIAITYNFGSSGSLQQQIEQGAPADIFISAAAKQMDALEKKQLILGGTRRNLLTNQIVLITPKNEKTITKFSDLTRPEVKKVALGEPKSVPAGQYGEEVFNYYKILDQVKSKLIYAKDVRQVLTYVETGNVNAGMVYLTDAKTSDQVRIAATTPKDSHKPIVYPIAVLKDSKNSDTAKAFAEFLSSNQAKTIFKKYGFGM